MDDLAEIPAKGVARRVWSDEFRNTVFFGIGALIVLGLASFWPVVGRIGFWLLAALAVFDGLQALITVVIPTLIIPVLALRGHGVDWREERWMFVALVGRLAGLGVFILILLYIRTRIL